VRVLVVEDDADWATLLCEIIDMAGHECVGTASSVEEALCTSSLKTPDVAILDIGLRGPMLGIEGAQILRTYFPSIALIFATGYSDPMIVQATASLHAVAYLVKPIAPNQVRAALAACESQVRSTPVPRVKETT
jgi:DNA-binding response OmpR family regulator